MYSAARVNQFEMKDVEHLRQLLFKAMFETYQNFTMKNKKGFY